MTFWKWSRTAATNATADGTINWAEGQAPSTVNDSARAMMAAASKYRDDIAGAITTGNTSLSYTVTSYQNFDTLAHMDGAMIAFTPHTTNGTGTITLSVDGLTVKPIRFWPSSDELPAGTLIQGTPYVVTYNNANGEFYLHNMGPALYLVPLGTVLPYAGTSAPNSRFALAYGQAISRTTYATLFALLSTTFGIGDGSSTFNLPDLRGRIVAGKDDMGGSAASRITNAGSGITATNLGASGGAETVTLGTGNIPQFTPAGTINTPLITTAVTTGVLLGGGGSSTVAVQAGGSNTTAIDTCGALTFTGTAFGSASPTAVNNMPPAIVLNQIIRVI